MSFYLITFPSRAMQIPAEELPEVVDASHALVEEAKAAGAYRFGGGIDESVAPVLIDADGSRHDGSHPLRAPLDGGYTVLDLATRAEAELWAARIAAACRCPQELYVFGEDPAS
ncbi:hypothetical protein GCM10028787_18080 [Brachybacterium horti]